MTSGAQVPAGIAEVAMVVAVVLMVDEGTTVEETGLLVETATEEEAGLLVETTTEEEATVPPHPNWMLLNCQPATLLENADQTKAVMALALAPVKELSGTVIVWDAPVKPLMVKNLDV
jgi:hypothetical protein